MSGLAYVALPSPKPKTSYKMTSSAEHSDPSGLINSYSTYYYATATVNRDTIRQHSSKINQSNVEEYYEYSDRIFGLIRNYDFHGLKHYLNDNPKIDLTKIYDKKGYNPLHLSVYKNDETIFDLIMTKFSEYAIGEGMGKEEFEAYKRYWVNEKTGTEGFTPLHLASFRGNLAIIRKLINYGCDPHIVSTNGMTMMHLAAQGEQPISLVYFREKGLSPNIKDKMGCTPLHWACFNGAENSASYLVAWVENVNEQDNEGISPLHLAVRSGLSQGNIRIVRLLLLRGGERALRNNRGQIAMDILRSYQEGKHKATTSGTAHITDITKLLVPQSYCTCCMIKTPVRKIPNSKSTALFYLLISAIIEALEIIIVFPVINHQPLFFSSVSIFGLVLLFFMISWIRDPGYLKKPNATLLELVEKYDNTLVCPVCECLRTTRSRHCNICNRCVERFDHHCPWINNCVGTRNHVFFYLYILTLSVFLPFVVAILIWALVDVEHRCQRDSMPPCLTGASWLYNELFYVISTSLLIVFTGIFVFPLWYLCSVQTMNLLYGQTTSERYGYKGRASSSFADDGSEQSRYPKKTSKHCRDMCCGCQMQDQTVLFEGSATMRTRGFSSLSILSNDSFYVSSNSYHQKLEF